MTAVRPGEFGHGDVIAEVTPPPAARPRPIGPIVRPLEVADLEEVADVFLRVFRGIGDPRRRQAALPDVVGHLHRLYLGAPWHRPEAGSLVYRDVSGGLVGFLGSVEMHLRIGDRRLTASAMGTFMVSDPNHHARAALVLLRHHLANGLDVHFTDTANRTSLEFCRPLRCELMALHSLEWIYPIRPASLVLARGRRRWPGLPLGLAAPLARGLDRSLKQLVRGRDGPRTSADGIAVADMGRDAFVAAAPGLVADRRLRPDWSEAELGWLLDRAAERTGNGPLRLRTARGPDGRELGFWLVWAEEGGIAAVLQIFAAPANRRAVVAAILTDAERLGCVAVRGTTEPGIMDALYAVPGMLFHHKGATCARSRDPEAMDALRSGDAAIGGLTGESWTRLVADRF